MIDLEAYGEYGRYVVPYDIPNGPSRGFVFDGDTGVADLDHETAACHDWRYIVGKSKVVSDLKYMWGYIKDQRPLRAIGRFIGLTIGGHYFYCKNRRDRLKRGITTVLEERTVPCDFEDEWIWPVRTWLLSDLKRNEDNGRTL